MRVLPFMQPSVPRRRAIIVATTGRRKFARAGGGRGAYVIDRDHPARGVLMMIAAQAVFGVTDALQKWLMDSVPLMLVVCSRFALFVIFLAPAVLRRPARVAASPGRGLMILRGCAFLGATVLTAAALVRMPLATVTVLAFVGPFVVTALSALVLGEQVGWRRWSAIAVGFAGMLIVVRPGAGAASLGWDALLVLAAALCWSVGIIATRKLAGRADATTMLIWHAAVACALSLPFAIVTWKTPSAIEAGLLLVNGCVNLVGQWLIVRALQLAPVATVAPLTYTVLLWAILLGWLVFGTLPDGWTLAGAGIIIASGLYVWWREQVRARRRGAPQG
jgi:drug/metabolite transporter (DMT)-like permease